MSGRHEHFKHQADIGVRGVGSTLEEAFEQGAISLMQVICDYETVEPAEERQVTCQAPDAELLFTDWLNQLILVMAIEGMLFCDFDVTVEGDKLAATVRGEKADPDKHDISVEVKAATYAELKVTKTNEGEWIAQCVVDV